MNYLRWAQVHSAIAGANFALLFLIGFGTQNVAATAVSAFSVGVSLTAAITNLLLYHKVIIPLRHVYRLLSIL